MGNRQMRAGAWAWLLVVLLLPLRAGAAPLAATIGVTTTVDEYGSGAACSLREAIVAANTNSTFGGCPAGSGTDTINLPAGTYALTRIGPNEDASASGDLDILSPINLVGAGATATILDASNGDRVLDITGTITVSIAGVRLRDGITVSGAGGGLRNQVAAVTISYSEVITNRAAVGAGIANNGGSLTIQNTLIAENLAFNFIGGASNSSLDAQPGTLVIRESTIQANWGGGLMMNGTTILEHTRVISNTGNDGSNCGIHMSGFEGNTLLISNSLVSGNQGCGVKVQGPLTVTNSTVSNNGTVGFHMESSESVANIVNTTISGNRVGVSVNGYVPVNLRNVTITNHLIEGNNDGAGIWRGFGPEPVTLANTIIAGNDSLAGDGPDCFGTFVSLGYNLIGDSSGCNLTGDLIGVMTDTAALLGALAANHAWPWTHALLEDSPAINAGDPEGCLDHLGNLLATDQRGYQRPDRCDMGAFELDAIFFQVFAPFTRR